MDFPIQDGLLPITVPSLANRPRLAFLGLADAATATDRIEHRAVTRQILADAGSPGFLPI